LGRWGLAALAALVLSGCVHAPSPDAQLIDELKIEGAKKISEGEIKKHILTAESSWWPVWLWPLGHASWFDPNAWQADLRRIVRIYEAHGYYQARVTDEKVTESKKGHVKLVVKVSEGEPARIASLDIEGLRDVDRNFTRELLDSLPLKVGDIFLEDDWENEKAQLAARLREHGYAEVVVTGEAVVEADAAKANLSLDVATGKRYRFGKIFVATDPGAVVPARLIADTITPDVKPGDWFSESALAEAQGRIFQMGVFNAVKVNRGAPDAERGTVPVVVDVREAPFRSIRWSLGGGVDPIRSELRTALEYTDRNIGLARLFNRKELLDRLTLRGKLGVAVIPNVLDLIFNQQPVQKAGPTGGLGVEYELPRMFGLRTLSLNSTADFSRVLDNAFDYYGGEAKVGLLWRPRTDVTVFPSLNLGVYRLSSQIPVTSATGPTAALGCQVVPFTCVVSWADVTVEWDHRDNRLEPRNGWYASLSVQGGLSNPKEAIATYLRISPEVRGYKSFGAEQRLTLAGKLRAGTVVSRDDNPPVVARFFSGGAAMRGFNQRQLSPMVEVASTNSKGETTYDALPVGGSSLLEASVELRWEFFEDWVLAVFNDAGLVASPSLGPAVDFRRYLYDAVGLGIRYRTPLGPVRLDLAFRLPNIGGPLDIKPSGTTLQVPVQTSCFGAVKPASGYGGSPQDVCSFHLSIGEAF